MAKFLDDTGLGTLWAKIKATFVKDVKIDGTSVVSSGTASIPMASSSTKGVVKVDDAMSSSSTNPVQNKELTRWLNLIIGEDGYFSGSSAYPQLSLIKQRLGSLSLRNKDVNIKIYSFDEDDEENATLEWDIDNASIAVKTSYEQGSTLGTIFESAAGKWVKIVYTGDASTYFRALAINMSTKNTSSTVKAFYGHLRIGTTDYPEYSFTTWGSWPTVVYSESYKTQAVVILRPSASDCKCQIRGFRCLNTYSGNEAVLIGRSSSAFQLATARKLKTNLARTADSTFDGSADQLNIPVTGQLPDANIASASTWNAKQSALPTSGTASTTYAINVSGSSASCTGNAATATAFSSGTAKTKFDGISEGANKVEASSTNGNVKIDGTETTVYTHPSTTAASAAAKKVGKDALGHVVLGDALAKGDVGLGNVNNTAISVSATNGVTDSTNNVTYKYTHPTSSGNKHVPSGGSSGQFLGWSADGTAAWSDLPKDYTTLSPSSATIRAYKRYTIGKTNVNLSSANSVRATALIRIHVNYNDDLANSQVAEGMLITMLADICFRTGSLAEMRLDIIGESRWDYSKIRPVLVSFGITEDGITKYVIAIGLGDGTNGTTLQPFDYSYIDVMPLCSNAGWDWMNEGDDVGTYDYIAQAVRETGARIGTAVGSSKLPVYVNDKGEFAKVNASSTATELLCALPAWTSTPTDSTYLVRRDTGGAASFGQVTFSTVWNYIKGKMSSDPSGVLNGRVSGFTSNIWGTGAKRISLGYANMSATDAWYNAIFLLKTGYNTTIGDGRSIALMISYCHRSTGRRVSARVLVNNGWPLSLIPGVFTLETDNNTKLVVGVGVRDSNNDFVNLSYSEFNVVVLGKEESWTDNVTSDSVNDCDHWFPTAQQPDIVVVDELPSSPDSNKIYFV